MAPRSKHVGPWATLAETLKPTLRGSDSKTTQRRRGAAEFVAWADAAKHDLVHADTETVVTLFEDTLDVHRTTGGKLNKQGEACLVMARELLALAGQDAAKKPTTWAAVVTDIAKKMKGAAEPEPEPEPEPETAALPDPDPTPPVTEELEPMARATEETEEETDELEEGEELEHEDTEPEREEEEAPKRRRVAAPRVQYVQAVRAPRPATKVATGRSAVMKSILPRPEKIRLYKRNEMGKRELIEDFTVDEIGDMKLEAFIRQYIHPDYGNEGMDTEYIAYELDARSGNEKLPASSITVQGQQQAESTDPFTTARRAMGMLQEMQGMMQSQQPAQVRPDSILEDAKKRAASGGDMQSMFMLMMMERMQQQQAPQPSMQGDLLLKIIDRLDRVERGGGSSRAPGPDFGPVPGGFGPPPFPYPMPMPMAPQPEPQSNKLLDLAMAKLAQPPPSLADSVKDLLALQSLIQPKQGESSEVAVLRAEIRQLAGGSKPPPNSLEAGMETFEKMLTMQKAVATQVGGGSDVGGFFKSLITPEVAKAIASIATSATAKPVAAPAPAQQPVQVTQFQPPPPRDFNQPPVPVPPAVNDAAKSFMMAQTSEVQTARFVDLLMAMYLSNDPYYVKLLTPALEALNRAEETPENLKLPRKLATQLLHELRPQLANPDFVDACIATLALRAGVERLPETLISTRGKWTFNGQDVVMQADVAQPVPLTAMMQVRVPEGGFPPVEPSKSREERARELGYEQVETKVEPAQPVPAPQPVQLSQVAQPVPPPASEQVIELQAQLQALPEARPTVPV